MKQKSLLLLGIVFLIIAIAGGVGLYLFSNQKIQLPGQSAPSAESTPTSTPATQPVVEPQPTGSMEETVVPAGWQTYTNSEYGFQISYPDDYQALDDAENLYGWPNGVVLLYKGGQAYDIAVEVWDDESEYQAKYGPRIDDLVVKEVGGKHITILDNTQEPDNAPVIGTFRALG